MRLEKMLQAGLALRVGQLLEIGHLGQTENLDAAVREVPREARQRQTGAVHHLFRDDPVQVALPADELEAERVPPVLQPLAHGERHAARPQARGARAARASISPRPGR